MGSIRSFTIASPALAIGLAIAGSVAGCSGSAEDAGASAPTTTRAAAGVTPSTSTSPTSTSPASATPTSAAPSVTTPTHAPRAGTYVALGDSYAAGVGLEPLSPGRPTACRQSTRDVGHVLASATGYTLRDVACSGASTASLTSARDGAAAPQFDAITRDTRLVTVMIGGNDNSTFARALGTCAKLGFDASGKGDPCRRAHGDEFERAVKTTTYPALVRAFTTLRAKAPNAQIAVIGYPRLLPDHGGCFPSMPVADGDVTYLGSLQATLDSALRRASRAAGVTFVDASSASVGHDACQVAASRWVEPLLGGTTQQPAHPNAQGEAALADLARRALHLT